MAEEQAPNSAAEQKYALLTSLLDSTPDNWSAPFREAATLIGTEDLKPYQQALIDRVFEQVAQGPEIGEGAPIVLSKDLSHALDTFEDKPNRNVKHIYAALDRIISFPHANREARKIALKRILQPLWLKITSDTIQSVHNAFESPKKDEEGTFEHYAVEEVVRQAADYVECYFEKETPTKAMYDLVITQLIAGHLPEALARGFTVSLASRYTTSKFKNHAVLGQIASCESLAPDIREYAQKMYLKGM